METSKDFIKISNMKIGLNHGAPCKRNQHLKNGCPFNILTPSAWIEYAIFWKNLFLYGFFLMYYDANMNSTIMDNVLFDYGRLARIGLPEAVFCEGKPLETLTSLLRRFADGDPPILFTRLTQEIADRLPPDALAAYDYDPVSRTAFSARLTRCGKGSVGIISGGSADAPVVLECTRTLTYLGISATLFMDMGISALWRLTGQLEKINFHDVVIVVAGMEGALASVVGGLCARPVFAVPTSIGYGVSSQGKTALSAMLASCAPGIGVLNIDNGYGAACAAARIINLIRE